METDRARRQAMEAMKAPLAEHGVMFAHIVKWVALATVIGIIIGGSTAFFLRVLGWSIDWTAKWPMHYLAMPLAFAASSALVHYLAPQAEGHGTEKVIEAVHRRWGKMDPRVIPVKLLSTVITIASGGSAGKEGPSAQIGAGMASLFADLFRFGNAERRKLVICGISAGFAAVFGTPIAGAIFGVEVLFVGSLQYDVLLPSFISGLMAYHVASAAGVSYFQPLIQGVPAFGEAIFLKTVAGGVFFGLCSVGLIETLRLFERLSHRIKLYGPLKAFLAALVLVGLTALTSHRYLGLGLDVLQQAIGGQGGPWYDCLMKTLFTSITLSFGGSGGILTPTFVIGATAGNLFAHLIGLNPVVFSAIGMVALLAGAANTPIAASIMAVELFGPTIGPYAAVACVISFLMTGHRSVYPSQILSVAKSPSLHVELGQELQHVLVEPYPRMEPLLKVASRLIEWKKPVRTDVRVPGLERPTDKEQE